MTDDYDCGRVANCVSSLPGSAFPILVLLCIIVAFAYLWDSLPYSKRDDIIWGAVTLILILGALGLLYSFVSGR